MVWLDGQDIASLSVRISNAIYFHVLLLSLIVIIFRKLAAHLLERLLIHSGALADVIGGLKRDVWGVLQLHLTRQRVPERHGAATRSEHDR